jgi:hypothetical protein
MSRKVILLLGEITWRRSRRKRNTICTTSIFGSQNEKYSDLSSEGALKEEPLILLSIPNNKIVNRELAIFSIHAV